jgi:hypothetical protein
LKEVDFFYDLKPEDPPWGWLGCVVCKNAMRVCKQGLVFTYFRDLRSAEKRTLKWGWQNKGKEYMVVLAQLDSTFKFIDSKPIRSIYFSHDLLRKVVSLKINDSFIYTYVEIWDPNSQKTWYGEPGITEYQDKASLLYPNKDCFGIWI